MCERVAHSEFHINEESSTHPVKNEAHNRHAETIDCDITQIVEEFFLPHGVSRTENQRWQHEVKEEI